jgi:hypothetical protein
MKLRTTCWRILELTLLRSGSGGIGLGSPRLEGAYALWHLPKERCLYWLCMNVGVLQAYLSYPRALAQHAHSVKSP